MKTLIITGSAPCLLEDFSKAVEARPEAEVMAINESGGAIEHIDHLYVGHYYKAAQFIAYRLKKYPDSRPFKVHACWTKGREKLPGIDCWWEANSGGTSSFTAARIGKLMGFDEIILCGCPMDNSGYFNEEETHKSTRIDPRIGYEKKLMEMYRKRFKSLAEQEGDGIFSMSGWTREVLGGPAI